MGLKYIAEKDLARVREEEKMKNKRVLEKFIRQLKKEYPHPSPFLKTGVELESLNEQGFRKMVDNLVVEVSHRRLNEFGREHFYVMKDGKIEKFSFPKLLGETAMSLHAIWDKDEEERRKNLKAALHTQEMFFFKQFATLEKLMKDLNEVDATIYVHRFFTDKRWGDNSCFYRIYVFTKGLFK